MNKQIEELLKPFQEGIEAAEKSISLGDDLSAIRNLIDSSQQISKLVMFLMDKHQPKSKKIWEENA